MKWSPRVEKAFTKAAILHEGQYRKGQEHIPMIVHLLGAALLVSECTDDENTIIAALLHDSIEDTAYTVDALRADFGDAVAEIVRAVTIPEMHEGTIDKPWKDAHHGYYLVLKEAPEAALFVAAADKIHNFNSVLAEYKDEPARFAADFKGGKEDRLHFYGAVVELIASRLTPEHPLSQKLLRSWHAYEAFVHTVPYDL